MCVAGTVQDNTDRAMLCKTWLTPPNVLCYRPLPAAI